MKKVLPLIFAGSIAVVGTLIAMSASASKDDADTIDSVVGSMAAEDLTPIDTGGGGSTVPDLKVEDVLSIVEHLREVEKHNGHLGIARKLKVSTQQVKAVARAIKKRLQELAPEPIE